MKWTTVYIGLGSNVGDRQKNLFHAIELLIKNNRIRIEKSSSMYETSPVGTKQRNFFNAVIKIRTGLSPHSLLTFLKKIEKKLKREKTFCKGPRTIDLDLIFYGRRKMCSRILTIPHPGFQKRKFVLQPLCEIAPRLKPIGSRKTVSQLLVELTDPKQKVKLIK